MRWIWGWLYFLQVLFVSETAIVWDVVLGDVQPERTALPLSFRRFLASDLRQDGELYLEAPQHAVFFTATLGVSQKIQAVDIFLLQEIM